MDQIFLAMLFGLQLPSVWVTNILIALIPGIIIGRVLYRKGRGLWSTVLAAELLMLMIFAVVELSGLILLPSVRVGLSSSWTVSGYRIFLFLLVLHVARFIPAFIAVLLGYFLARRRVEKNI